MSDIRMCTEHSLEMCVNQTYFSGFKRKKKKKKGKARFVSCFREYSPSKKVDET